MSYRIIGTNTGHVFACGLTFAEAQNELNKLERNQSRLEEVGEEEGCEVEEE